MTPPAPGRFSTTNCCLRMVDSSFATTRVAKSSPDPGPEATMIFTGLFGNWAWAAPPSSNSITTTALIMSAAPLFHVVQRSLHEIHILHVVGRVDARELHPFAR